MTPTATVMATSGAIDDFAVLATFTAIANIVIRIPSAATAPTNFVGFTNDNATTAAVITPMAIDIAIKFPLQSLAFLVANINPAMNAANIPTAITPCASFLSGI